MLGGTGSAAIVRNIGIDSAALYGSPNSDAIGGLIGRNSGGTVSASYANSSVNGATSAMVDSLGGLIGITAGGIIIASHASGSVTGGTGTNTHLLGGLVGNSTSTTPTFIIASYATAAVTSGAGGDLIGGLVGSISNITIVASYVSGVVTGGAAADTIGGLVGQNPTALTITIAASYASGAVTGGAGIDQVGALQGIVFNDASRITASYATGDVDGGGDADSAGRLVALTASANTVNASYGFGTVTAMNINNAGAPPMAGMPPMILTSANGLTLANAGAQWNDADYLTLNAWDFGTDMQPPALKYADYDGDGTDYGCGTTTGTVATIPSVVPNGNGGTMTVDCGTTLLPGQR